MTRKQKSRRHRRSRSWIVLAALCALGLGGVALHARSTHAARNWLSEKVRAPRFTLEVVEFIGLERLDPEVLLRLARLTSSLPLIDLDLDILIERMSSHPRVASCVAARIPPDRLVVEIEERVPVARRAERREGLALDGVAFPLMGDEGATLPELRGEVKWALPLLRAAQELGVELAEIEIRSQSDLLVRPVERALRLRIGPDAEASLRTWLRIRDTDLLGRYAAREVDLRFRGSVVLRELRKTTRGREDGSS